MFKEYPNYKRFTIGALCRLLTPLTLSDEIEKVIYLDSDLIVNLDISELWRIQIDDKPLAAVAEIEHGINSKEFFLLCREDIVKPEDYFNSGVLILNLEQIRKSEQENLQKGIQYLAENPKYPFFDQEILNYCFSKAYFKLPKKFNYWRTGGNPHDIGNLIFHYLGKNLKIDMNDKAYRLWFSYFEKTPFFNKDVIESLNLGYRQFINQRDIKFKSFAVQLTALMSGRTRAFCTTLLNIDAMKKFFFIREDEEIIPIENQESFQRLANSMKNSLGKKIFFILFFEGYPQLRAALINAGFVEGRDFINAAMFLSDANGVPFNTYELVRNM